MNDMFRMIAEFLEGSGFGQVTHLNLAMIAIGCLFIYLAIKKGFEPLLLVPIGFGILIGNIPYDSRDLQLSVYDGPVSQETIEYIANDLTVEIQEHEIVDGRAIPVTKTYEPWSVLPHHADVEALAKQEHPDRPGEPAVIMVATEEFLTYGGRYSGPGIYQLQHGGHQVYIKEPADDKRYPVVVSPSRQNTWGASVMWFLFRGIEWGFYPPLIFLGVGALTDFGPLLANPRLILLGAAAQFGIFFALLSAVFFDFSMQEAASIGIIGGADGPTAIFTATKLAPHLLGAVALSAYSYMAMVPIIQPPIIKLLTTKQQRRIRMDAPKNVPKLLRILFPIVAFLLTAFIANGALPLLGMLFFGNLLRESLVTERLAKTAGTTFIDIVTILLGVTVGAKTQAGTFLTPETLGIALLGIVAFSVATATGLLFGHLLNFVSKEPINPIIGAAGVSAVPMAARVVQKVAQEEDPQNFLLMHAMGPNVAGVIGSAVAAGVLLSYFAG